MADWGGVRLSQFGSFGGMALSSGGNMMLGGASLVAQATTTGAHIGAGLMAGIARSLESDAHRLGSLVTSTVHSAVGLAARATATAIGAAVVSTVSAIQAGQRTLALSQMSGRSIGSAGGTLGNLAALGVDPSSVSGLQRDVWMQGMMSRAYGIGGEFGSRQFMDDYRRRFSSLYNSGPMGRALAGNMERSLGTQSLRGVALMDDRVYSRQMERSQQMHSALGMSPEDVRRVAEDFSLLGASLRELGRLSLARLGSRLIERFGGFLDSAVDKLSKNSGAIDKAIDAGIGKITDFARFLYVDVPLWIGKGIDASASVLEGFANRVPDVLNRMGSIFDSGVSALEGVYTRFGGLFDSLLDRINAFLDAARQAIKNPGEAVEGITGSRAARIGVNAAKTYFDATKTAGNAAGGAVESVTGSSFLGDIAAVAVPLGLGWIAKSGAGALGRYLFGGAAANAASGAAQGAASRGLLWNAGRAALMSPVGRVVGIGMTVGTGLGYAYNRGMQAIGAGGEDQGFMQHMATGAGRFADFLTGNPGHYDREWYRQQAEQQARLANAEQERRERAARIGNAAQSFVHRSINTANANAFRAESGISSAHDAFQRWQRDNIGSREERQHEFNMLARLTAAAERTAENTKDNAQKQEQLVAALGRGLIKEVLARVTQDEYFDLLRVR